MIVAVEEAKRMICPMYLSYSAQKERRKDRCCEASKCMAWRWRSRSVLAEEKGIPPELKIARGYCGLAGKP